MAALFVDFLAADGTLTADLARGLFESVIVTDVCHYINFI